MNSESRENLANIFVNHLEENQSSSFGFINVVEATLYESAMRYQKGNQVQAAKALGVSRGTLRSKLLQYFDTTQIGGLYHRKPVLKIAGKEIENQ